MNKIKFRNKIIEAGQKSVKTEKEKVAREGGKHGFELCKKLETQDDFEKELKKRHTEELEMANKLQDNEINTDTYWESRWATLQIEHVYEVMKFVWNFDRIKQESFLGSANAGITFARILKKNPDLIID